MKYIDEPAIAKSAAKPTRGLANPLATSMNVNTNPNNPPITALLAHKGRFFIFFFINIRVLRNSFLGRGFLGNTGIFLLKNPYARPSACAMFRKSPAFDEFRNSK